MVVTILKLILTPYDKELSKKILDYAEIFMLKNLDVFLKVNELFVYGQTYYMSKFKANFMVNLLTALPP